MAKCDCLEEFSPRKKKISSYFKWIKLHFVANEIDKETSIDRQTYALFKNPKSLVPLAKP